MGNLIYNLTSTNLASFRSLAEVPIQSCKVYFSVIQNGSGNASTTNIRNFVTRTGIKVTHHGKNFISPEYTSFNGQSSYTNNGDVWNCTPDGVITFTSGSNSTGRSCIIKERTTKLFILPNGDYILTGRPVLPENNTDLRLSWTRGSSATVQGYDDGAGTVVSATSNTNSFGITIAVTQNFTSNSTITIKPMIRLPQDNDIWEPYIGNTYDIDWSNIAGPLVGGYIDIINGTLVNTYDRIVFTGTLDWTHIWGTDTANGAFRLANFVNYGYKGAANTTSRLASFARHNANVISSKTTQGFYIGGSPVYLNVRNADSITLGSNTHLELAEQWKQEVAAAYAAGTPYEITYLLNPANYQTYQLTPIQLTAFIGRNNIFSNIWLQIDVSYPLVEANDMLQAKKRIFNNSYVNNND